jgi:hypothetical protein
MFIPHHLLQGLPAAQPIAQQYSSALAGPSYDQRSWVSYQFWSLSYPSFSTPTDWQHVASSPFAIAIGLKPSDASAV